MCLVCIRSAWDGVGGGGGCGRGGCFIFCILKNK